MTLSMLVAATATGHAGHQYEDVPDDHQFHDEITAITDRDIADGYEDGTFRPMWPVSRQAMVAFLHRIEGEPEGPFPDPGFDDVDEDDPFYHQISWAVEAGIAEGYPDNTFRSTNPVSRQAAAAFLHRQAGSPEGPFPDPGFDDVDEDSNFYTEIAWMAEIGITEGYEDNTFRPTTEVSRQAMAAFLIRFLDRPIEGDIAGTVTDAATGEPIENAGITLENDVTQTATTDGSGEYLFEDVPEGTDYSVTADAEGYESQTETAVEVTDGATTIVDFELALVGNQTFEVAPEDEQWLPTDGERDYSATGFAADTNEVVLDLADAANVTIENGTVTFSSTNDQADFGDVAAQITDVEVDGTVVPGFTAGDSVSVDEGSTVSFTVVGDENTVETVVPVVYDADNGLPVDDAGEPESDFGIGGQLSFADVDTIVVEPEESTNPFGTDHTVEATLATGAGNLDNGDSAVELEGETVDMTVYEATLDAEQLTCPYDDSGSIPSGQIVIEGSPTTDGEGTATFTYTGPEAPEDAVAPDDDEMHCILAEWQGEQDSAYEGQSAWGEATKTWSAESDEVADVTLEPAEATNQVGDGSHTVTATVTDRFDRPIEGAEVEFTLERDFDSERATETSTFTRTTSEDGQASLTYSGPSEAATDTITAAADGESDQATKRWLEDGVENLDSGEWYEEIQTAVDAEATEDGHTLRVFGDHADVADVTKSLTLQSDEATLAGSFLVNQDAVTITGFEISELETVLGEVSGIYVNDGSADVTITDNVVTGAGDGRAILTTGTTSGEISGNVVTDVTTGLFFQGQAEYSVTGNDISDAVAGIGTDVTAGSVVNISNNTLTDNDEGIGLNGPGVVVESNQFALTEAVEGDVYVTDYTDGFYVLETILAANDFTPEGEVEGNQIVPVLETATTE